MADEIVDDFIGQKFGKDGHLTVIDKIKDGKNSYFIVECSVCKNDPELFGKGQFKLRSDAVKKGGIPCGCSGNVQWNLEQIKVRISRVCSSKDFEFLGFDDENTTLERKIKLRCNKDSHTWTTTAHSLLRGNGSCAQCANLTRSNLMSKRNKTSDEDKIAIFRATGNFPVDAVFTKIRDRTKKCIGEWLYHCPICSKDEMSKAELCNGNFKTDYANLHGGKLPCRCIKNKTLSEDQNVFRIKTALEK